MSNVDLGGKLTTQQLTYEIIQRIPERSAGGLIMGTNYSRSSTNIRQSRFSRRVGRLFGNRDIRVFWRRASTVPCETFEAVFTVVQDRTCDYGLIPIENSLAGSIHHNYDLSYATSNDCRRTLPEGAALPDCQSRGFVTDIRRVISHPQALAQCAGYLRSMKFTPIATYDTAGSVRILQEQKDPSQRLIASRRAAELYGMEVLAEGIEDDPANFTRFLAISPQPVRLAGEAKPRSYLPLMICLGRCLRPSVFALAILI